METKEKVMHTPTPWELPNGKDKNKFGTYRIGEKPYNGGSAAHLTNIALVGSLEDAEFIVRAVNSHAALLEAAKKVLHEWQSDILSEATILELKEVIVFAERNRP